MNIAELLKDCPTGMELYSPIFGDVDLDEVRPHLAVVVRTSDRQKEEFLYDGRFGINGECMLFPSKENRDWSTFQRPFKDGDVLAYQYPHFTNPTIYIHKYSQKLNTAFYVALSGNGDFKVRSKYSEALYGNDSSVRFATEEEKQELFDAIKANGYKWNNETKTLEKLIVPKFKVGDRIKLKNTPTNNILTVTKTNNDGSLNVNMYSWVIEYELQDKYELALNNQSKFKVGDKIKKKGDTRLISIKDVGDNYYIITIPDYFDNCYITDKLSFSNQDDYELVSDKFDINTLVPFESRVLVRSLKDNKWCGAFFSHIDAEHHTHSYRYVTTAVKSYPYCIPYKGNEHLLNTVDDCDNYYKTWE